MYLILIFGLEMSSMAYFFNWLKLRSIDSKFESFERFYEKVLSSISVILFIPRVIFFREANWGPFSKNLVSPAFPILLLLK
jgi:hypothetical protein